VFFLVQLRHRVRQEKSPRHSIRQRELEINNVMLVLKDFDFGQYFLPRVMKTIPDWWSTSKRSANVIRSIDNCKKWQARNAT